MLSSDNVKYGYNAATGKYEDLMAAGIIDPTKVCSNEFVIFVLSKLGYCTFIFSCNGMKMIR